MVEVTVDGPGEYFEMIQFLRGFTQSDFTVNFSTATEVANDFVTSVIIFDMRSE
jgi:hypothetical protein